MTEGEATVGPKSCSRPICLKHANSMRAVLSGRSSTVRYSPSRVSLYTPSRAAAKTEKKGEISFFFKSDQMP